jgi:hypothetical protein
MKIRPLGLSVLTLIVLSVFAPRTLAQAMPSNAAQVIPQVPGAGEFSGGHRWSLFGRFRNGPSTGSSQGGMPSGSGTNAAGTRGLPRGRRYYNGRYFGSFNNRFYSPQYGYF